MQTSSLQTVNKAEGSAVQWKFEEAEKKTKQLRQNLHFPLPFRSDGQLQIKNNSEISTLAIVRMIASMSCTSLLRFTVIWLTCQRNQEIY